VEFLSDSLCAGRQTGTPGATGAAFYLIRRLHSLGYEVEYDTFRTERGAVGRNLVTKQKGSKAAILLMASYDGLGRIGTRLYPGADSNASGVAALGLCFRDSKYRGDATLEMAKELVDSGRSFDPGDFRKQLSGLIENSLIFVESKR
jgi:hypothetical protein